MTGAGRLVGSRIERLGTPPPTSVGAVLPVGPTRDELPVGRS